MGGTERVGVMKRFLSCCAGFLLCSAMAGAVPPGELDYQGKVLIDDLPFSGSGGFKFAIANDPYTTNFWSHDGTPTGTPTSHIVLAVQNGVFSVVLGRSPMPGVPASLFALQTSLNLRVWFSSSPPTGFAEMLPAQRIVSVGYALNAGLLDGLHASNIVSAATNAVTLAGDVSGPVGNIQIGAGVINDTDISGSAAIAPTKISGTALTQSTIFGGDISGAYNNLQIGANTVGSAEIAPGAISDSDVSASAAIQGTKIQSASTVASGVLPVSAGFGAAMPYAAIDDSDTRLNAYGVVNGLTSAAPGSALSILGVAPVYVSNQAPSTIRIGMIASGPAPLPALDHVVWVATNGTATGPGTISAPYDTPQNGYNAAAAKYPGVPSAVVIAAGDYSSQSLSMTAPEVHVIGLARPQLAGVTVSLPASTVLVGKTRVENLVFTDLASVVLSTAPVKFRNCRFEKACSVAGDDAEFQDCAFRQGASGYALLIAPAGVPSVNSVGVYQSSIVNLDPLAPALQIGGVGQQEPNAFGIEVIGCEIINREGFTGPAITDYTPFLPAGAPIHLFAHNYIRGPRPLEQGGGVAVADPNAQGLARFIGFFNNTVYGHCGSAPGGIPHAQYFANNHLFGLINFSPPQGVGWIQAGTGSVSPDAANNTEHDLTFPTMPGAWND